MLNETKIDTLRALQECNEIHLFDLKTDFDFIEGSEKLIKLIEAEKSIWAGCTEFFETTTVGTSKNTALDSKVNYTIFSNSTSPVCYSDLVFVEVNNGDYRVFRMDEDLQELLETEA